VEQDFEDGWGWVGRETKQNNKQLYNIYGYPYIYILKNKIKREKKENKKTQMKVFGNYVRELHTTFIVEQKLKKIKQTYNNNKIL